MKDTSTPQNIRGGYPTERGWTSELATLHLPRLNGWWSTADAEAVEASPEFKVDKARVANGLPVIFTPVDLKGRGWTRTLMRRHLGDPDVVVELRDRPRVAQFYGARRVENAEATSAWLADAAKAKTRSDVMVAAAERKRQSTVAAALDIEIWASTSGTT